MEEWTKEVPEAGIYECRYKSEDGSTTKPVLCIVFPASKDEYPWVQTPNLETGHEGFYNYFADPNENPHLEYRSFTNSVFKGVHERYEIVARQFRVIEEKKEE
jgi:hypothetical protein